MGKNKKIITFSLVIGLILFGYILGNTPIDETIKLLDKAKAIHITLYILFSLMLFVGHTVSWDIILRSQGERIQFRQLMNYRMADHAVSFLTPGPKIGGEFTRASLTAENHNIEYSKALSSCVLDKLVITSSEAFFLSGGMLVSTMLIPMPLGWKIFLYAITASFLLLAGIFYYYLSTGKKFFHSLFENTGLYKINAMKKIEKDVVKFEKYLKTFYKRDKKHFFWSHVTCILSRTFSLFEFKFLMLMLGFDIGVPELFFITTMIGVAYLVPVFMGFGVLEAGQLSVFSILNLPTNAGVLVAMMTRVRDLLWSAWGLIVIGFKGLDIGKALTSLRKNSTDYFLKKK